MPDTSAEISKIRKKLVSTSIRSKRTDKMLQSHIDECAKLQKWVLRLGIVTLIWVVTHSPEAVKAFAGAARVLFP